MPPQSSLNSATVANGVPTAAALLSGSSQESYHCFRPTLLGGDAAVHMAEEVRDAGKTIS
jgi:hypothetical protein